MRRKPCPSIDVHASTCKIILLARKRHDGVKIFSLFPCLLAAREKTKRKGEREREREREREEERERGIY